MKSDIYLPSDILKPYVSQFVISEDEGEKIYKVFPGTGLVIGFQYKGKLASIYNDKEISLDISGITGLHDRYKIFKTAGEIGSVLVYFKDGGAAAFFKDPLQELFRESVSLENFMLRSELLVLEEQLVSAKDDKGRIRVIEQFLISRIRDVQPDKLVLTALAVIHQHKGNIRISDLTEQLNISQSPLEKRFRQVVGTSPKKFASIVRFKHTLQNYDPKKSLTQLGYESGFYDQAHFIREFRSFTGESPESFFSPRG